MQLVELLKLCLVFEISEAMLDQIDKGFQLWVEDYEKWASRVPLVYYTKTNTGYTTKMIPLDLAPVF